jgi:hypothetical protein
MDDDAKSLIDGAIFAIRLSESNNEEFRTDRMYFIGTSLPKALYAASILEHVTKGKCFIEVWHDNEPNPRGMLAPSNGSECPDCELKDECAKKNGDSKIRHCPKQEKTWNENGNIYGSPSKNGTTPAGIAMKESDKKPSGLTADITISDMLLEAFKAMNPKDKNVGG